MSFFFRLASELGDAIVLKCPSLHRCECDDVITHSTDLKTIVCEDNECRIKIDKPVIRNGTFSIGGMYAGIQYKDTMIVFPSSILKGRNAEMIEHSCPVLPKEDSTRILDCISRTEFKINDDVPLKEAKEIFIMASDQDTKRMGKILERNPEIAGVDVHTSSCYGNHKECLARAGSEIESRFGCGLPRAYQLFREAAVLALDEAKNSGDKNAIKRVEIMVKRVNSHLDKIASDFFDKIVSEE